MKLGVLLLFIALFVLTVSRARQSGTEWRTIIGTFSQYFNFLIGGNLSETFSARTGRHVLNDNNPSCGWNITCFFLDLLFMGVERNHCFKSAKRKIEYDTRHRDCILRMETYQ
jgi:hypothetical protein